MKHIPFQSIYRQNFEVVEQRQGNVTFYPHNDQLPILARAINLEFYGGLPPKVARVDHRADDFHKIILNQAALAFCANLNGARTDQLRFYHVVTSDRVTKVAIVQQVTEHSSRGLRHRFRFYCADGYFPDLHTSGKQLVFADHVLQRFNARVPGRVGDDLMTFLLIFIGSLRLALPVGPGRAFVMPHLDGLLAFTYEAADTEYIITTCLTTNEIHSLGREFPPEVPTLHYGPAFTRPAFRSWPPHVILADIHKAWQRKTPFKAVPAKTKQETNWHDLAYWIKGNLLRKGLGPGSTFRFLDNIHGPLTTPFPAGFPEIRLKEEDLYRNLDIDALWTGEVRMLSSAPTPPRP